MADEPNATATGEGAPAPDTFTADDVKKLQDTISLLTEKNKGLDKNFKELKKSFDGVDAQEYRTMKEKQAQLEKELIEKDPKKMEEHYSKKELQLRETWDKEKQALEEELQKVRGINKTLAVTDKVLSVIGSKFNDDALKFIKREVEERCDLDDEGNIFIKDDNGDIMYRGAKPVTVQEFGELLVDQFPSLAKPTGSSGGKDVTPGQKVAPRGRGLPETYQELQRMPNARQVLDQMKKENPAQLAKILKTMN